MHPIDNLQYSVERSIATSLRSGRDENGPRAGIPAWQLPHESPDTGGCRPLHQRLAGGARLANIPTARRSEMTCFALDDRLAALDARFMHATTAPGRHMPGAGSEWRYRVPKVLVGELREDVERLRLIEAE
jgi:hypothetical protein